MSSNDSTSSSRLSQFGLYRTIDARTEEFLKLSRKRQIRQGCACAAVSTAVTVTVVVSILFLYGYGVSSASSATLRTSSWFDLMNDSTDTTLFDDKFQNTIKFDRASMNLLPVFFDKDLEDQESSSQKYDGPPETNYKRSVYPGSTNPFLAQAKVPTPGLYSIQYKTYPVLYIPSPRNSEYYMKVRKTREYERIMSYIDKMINEKVGFGSRSIRNQQYPTSVEKITENPWTGPIARRKTTRVITKPKESKSTKIILRLNKNSKQRTMSNVKFNNSMINENKNCKCRNHFGTLLDKILNCFQHLVKTSSELPCNNKSSTKTATEMKNQITERPTTTTAVTTTTVKPVTITIPSTTTIPTSIPTKPTTTTNTQTDMTEFSPEIFHFSNNFLQKPALPNKNKIKPKELLSQMSPFYMMTGNNNSKNNISNSNILAPIKPKSKIFSTNYQKKKVITTQNNKAQNLTFLTTEKKVEEGIIPTSTSTTTVSLEKSEEIFQNLLFPETKDREYARLPQKAIKKYSTDYVLRPKSYERIPSVIKPHTTTEPSTTSTSHRFIQQKIDNHKKVSTENIVGKPNSRPYAPVVPTNNRPFYGITPEDYIMERIRHELSKKQNANTIKSPEPIKFQGDKREKAGVFDRIKNLLKTKLMQSRRKTDYNKLSSQIMKSKTKPKYVESKLTNSPQEIKFGTEYVSKYNFVTLPTPYASTTTKNNFVTVPTPFTSTTTNNNFATLPTPNAYTTTKNDFGTSSVPYISTTTNNNFGPSPTPYASTTTYNRITTSTTYTPSVLETSTSPTQLTKYTKDPFLPEITTQPALKELVYNGPFPKLGRRNTPYNSREYIWGEDDIYKAALYDSLHGDFKTNSSSKNNSIPTTTTERVKKSSTVSKDVQTASINNNEKNAWASSQTDEPYKYMIPVGRKSYLEISRGDWKQKEPHAYDTNVMYDVFDEMDGV